MRTAIRIVFVALLSVLAAASLTSCASLKAFFAPKTVQSGAPRETAPPVPATKEQIQPPAPPPPAPPPKEVAPPPPTAPKETPPPAVAPATPPVPPPKEKTQPPVLSPQVGTDDVQRLKQESTSRIQQTEEMIRPIDQTRLTKNQQETYAIIQSFLNGAKQALVAQDYLRASNLADKAHALAEEISRSPK